MRNQKKVEFSGYVVNTCFYGTPHHLPHCEYRHGHAKSFFLMANLLVVLLFITYMSICDKMNRFFKGAYKDPDTSFDGFLCNGMWLFTNRLFLLVQVLEKLVHSAPAPRQSLILHFNQPGSLGTP